MTALQALLYHLFLASRSFRLRSRTSSGRSIRFVLSKSDFRILVIFSIMSSFSRSMRACRSLCDTRPLEASDSFCFPSIPRLTTREAPMEKRTKGRPALKNRNVLEGGGEAFPLGFNFSFLGSIFFFQCNGVWT